MKINYKAYMKKVAKLVHECEDKQTEFPDFGEKRWTMVSYYMQIKEVVQTYEQDKEQAENLERLGDIASGADE